MHASLSLQPTPSLLFGLLHVPPLHVPATWHWSSGVHTFGEPAHAPTVQTSFTVHPSPSSQVLPSVFVPYEQVPVAAAHVNVWHVPGVHEQAAQLGLPVPAANVPAAHVVQDALPEPEAYMPSAHAVHEAFPVPLANVPASHGVHVALDVAPVELLAVPAPQAVQDLLPVPAAYVPAPQVLHSVLPVPLATLPARQAVHVALPVASV